MPYLKFWSNKTSFSSEAPKVYLCKAIFAPKFVEIYADFKDAEKNYFASSRLQELYLRNLKLDHAKLKFVWARIIDFNLCLTFVDTVTSVQVLSRCKAIFNINSNFKLFCTCYARALKAILHSGRNEFHLY